METCGTEEPYEGKPHVRTCGGAGWATTGSTRTRAKVSPKPWNWEQSHEMGCGYPVGAHQEVQVPPDQSLASRSGVKSTCTPSNGSAKLEGQQSDAPNGVSPVWLAMGDSLWLARNRMRETITSGSVGIATRSRTSSCYDLINKDIT